MSLPFFLLTDLRLSFRNCALQHAASRRCPFSVSSGLLKRRAKFESSTKSIRTSSPPASTTLNSRPHSDTSPSSHTGTTELVRKEEQQTAIDRERKSDVPMKVLPRAQLTSSHKLSPMQRLHIEHLTRHPPKEQAPRTYKEKLLIYHFGVGRVNMMVFSRVTAIAALGFITVIWLPAYYKNGTPLPYLGLVWAASFIPILFVSWATRSIATEVWLKLPLFARQSPHAAMTYAKNLPRDASIDVRFMRWTSHTGTVPINVVDTTPAKRTLLKPMSFKWIGPRVDTGTALRPNPTAFFVRPTSAAGRALRDTIPGLWGTVYKRLTGVEPGAVSKWRS